jgi:ketosteroid isomerase-like protein
MAAAVMRGLDAAPANASDTAEVTASPEDEIRDTLERYRRACEQKDLALLSEVYDRLSPAQIDANRRYFENARGLEVSIEEIDVALGQDKAAVSYTRRDRFIDNETGRPTKVEVRLTKILVRVNDTWKLVSGPTRK